MTARQVEQSKTKGSASARARQAAPQHEGTNVPPCQRREQACLSFSSKPHRAPWTRASKPEPHRRLTVSAGVSSWAPARRATWRARYAASPDVCATWRVHGRWGPGAKGQSAEGGSKKERAHGRTKRSAWGPCRRQDKGRAPKRCYATGLHCCVRCCVCVRRVCVGCGWRRGSVRE